MSSSNTEPTPAYTYYKNINFPLINKILFIGDKNVGKTTLLYYKLHNNFITDYFPTIGIEYFNLKHKYYNIDLKYQIWSSSIYDIIHYIGINIIIFMFDLSNINTLNKLKKYYNNLINNYKLSNIILLGTKSDIKNIPYEIINDFINILKQSDINIKYFEISTLINENIIELFDYIYFTTYNNFNNSEQNLTIEYNLDKKKSKEQSNFNCCCCCLSDINNSDSEPDTIENNLQNNSDYNYNLLD